jgi:small ligand-binding sensory domain FIST
VAFASALSEHPVTAHALGEVTGQVLDRLGEAPAVALLFVTSAHAGALEDAAGVVRTLLRPTVVIGCAAESVAGTGREVEGGGGVSLWAGSPGAVEAVDLRAVRTAEGLEVAGWPDEPGLEPSALVLLGDPYSFPTEDFLTWLEARRPGLVTVGGMASAAHAPGANRLVVDEGTRSSGAVGVLLGAGSGVSAVVSQGCRPVGRPLIVTRAEGNVVFELAGKPALERLLRLAEEEMTQAEIETVNSGGLHLGRVVDEHRESFAQGDFLVRNVLGADRSSGAIAVGDEIPVGTTVQFHIRDATTADEDLRAMLRSRSAEAALLFTCNGRGTRLFGSAHHDASVIEQEIGPVPMAGFAAAGELGPLGKRNFLHGFTASIALFGAAGCEPGPDELPTSAG